MKTSVKILLCLLLVLVQVFVAVGCGGSGNTSDTTDGNKTPQTNAPNGTTGGVETTDEPYSLPEMNFDGATFKIAGLFGGYEYTYFAEEDDGTGLVSAIYNRDTVIEDQFGIDFEYTTWQAKHANNAYAAAALQESVFNGEHTIDLYVSSTAYAGELVQQGYFTNLAKNTYLNLDKPWYSQAVNDYLYYKDALFYVSGAYNLRSVSVTWSVFWNREYSEDLQIEDDLFELSREGEWTYDKMLTLAQKSVNGLDDPELATYGIIMTQYEGLNCLSYGLGRKMFTLNDEGGIDLEIHGSEENINIVQEMHELYGRTGLVRGENIYSGVDLSKLFQANRALFALYQIRMGEQQDMRDGVTYSCLPIPKATEEQEAYRCQTFADVSLIPASVKDRAMSEVILEALNYYSVDVYDVYYEEYFGYKIAHDDEAKEMLDLIRDSLYCDFVLANHGVIEAKLLFVYDMTEPASWWASNREAVLGNLNSFTAALDDLIEKEV